MYGKILNQAKNTPQTQPARKDQIPNNAGGYAFAVDKWAQLERFLILGSSSGTYYVGAKDLTAENLDGLKACLAEDGVRVIAMTIDISEKGRAIKNETAILVFAAAIAYGDNATKAAVRANIGKVCRTGTHILHFAQYANTFRSWGRALRSTVRAWYEGLCKNSVDSLAYQMTKYQQRDGWSHKDLIRLAHPGSNDSLCAALYDWALHGAKEEKAYPEIVKAFEVAKKADAKTIAGLIREKGLSQEMIPTEKKNDKTIAEALWEKAPMTAMIRNLGNMSKQGLLTVGSPVFQRVITALGTPDALKKARIHPISILVAHKTYESGHGFRGHNSWEVVPQIVDSLNKAFYLAFPAVEPTGKTIAFAVDTSGSMTAEVDGTPNLSAREAGAAMALVTAATEPNYYAMAFDTRCYNWAISPNQRLADVVRNMPGGGGTDCAQPIDFLLANRRKVDAIVIYTDSETWAGTAHHPYQAMEEYRKAVNPKAKLIVCATTATSITVAAPDDPLSLTICGFDSSVPEVIRAFIAE